MSNPTVQLDTTCMLGFRLLDQGQAGRVDRLGNEADGTMAAATGTSHTLGAKVGGKPTVGNALGAKVGNKPGISSRLGAKVGTKVD